MLTEEKKNVKMNIRYKNKECLEIKENGKGKMEYRNKIKIGIVNNIKEREREIRIPKIQ